MEALEENLLDNEKKLIDALTIHLPDDKKTLLNMYITQQRALRQVDEIGRRGLANEIEILSKKVFELSNRLRKQDSKFHNK